MRGAKVVSLFLLVFWFAFLWQAGSAQAQSTADTFYVVNTYGSPGDTILLPISLTNTISVMAYSYRIVFDSTYFRALDLDTVGTRIGGLNTWMIGFNSEDGWANIVWAGGETFPPGRGVVSFVRLWIKPSTPSSSYLIRFEDDPNTPQNENSFSGGTGNVYPTLVGGYVITAPPGHRPPILDPIPGGNQQSVDEGQTLSFLVSGSDLDGDSITLSSSNLPANSSFPTTSGDSTVSQTFSFTPAYGQGGNTYSVVFTITDTTGLSDEDTVNISVPIPSNRPPYFDPLVPAQSVDEGDPLTFTVRAADPDGDQITLDTSPSPLTLPNAQFEPITGPSPVSQTFTFTPDYTQGPDTITVVFTATDPHSATSVMAVQIIVINKYNILKVISEGGALPGRDYGRIPIVLDNSNNIYGVQFDLNYDPTILTIDSIIPGLRLVDMTYDYDVMSPGVVRFVTWGYNLETIAVGRDTILQFACSVDRYAPAGSTSVILTDAIEADDIDGNGRNLGVENGFFTVDTLGDINLDVKVNVLDVVPLIAYILGQKDFNVRQLANADVNQDGDVNVGDVVGIVNIVLGRPVKSGPMISYEPLAKVNLTKENRAISIFADLKVPVAGVQLKVRYDPEEVSLGRPHLTGWTDNMVLNFSDRNGVMSIVVYGGLSGEIIGLGQGDIVEVPVISKNGEDVNFELVEAILANEKAEVIYNQNKLPRTFYLGQNYPNPFNPTTNIEYYLPQDSWMKLDIYNVLGQKVFTLVNEYQKSGYRRITWDGRDNQGRLLSSGIYLYLMSAGEFTQTKKMVLLK